MKQQHYRMTLEEAIALHQCGLISSTALLYCYLRIRLAPGWKITLHQREISQQLGISKAAFYKGIQRLKDKKLIDWEAPNGVVVILGQIGDFVGQIGDFVGQIGDFDPIKKPYQSMLPSFLQILIRFLLNLSQIRREENFSILSGRR
jgi:hypothetical protein